MNLSDRSVLTSEEYSARRTGLLQNLSKADATAVAVFGFGSALGMGTQSHGAIRYLSGWDSHEATSLLVFDRDQVLLLLSSPFMLDLAKTICPTFEIIALPAAEWAAAINGRFAAVGTIYTVGFDEMPSLTRAQIASETHSERFLSADAILAEMRLVKSQSEIAKMAEGAGICDDLFASLGRYLLEDRSIWQTQLHLETTARLAGADYCKTWLTVKDKADYPRYWPKDSLSCPRHGEQVLFGIALTVDGYYAHGIRMGSIGPAKPEHKAMWKTVHNALLAGAEVLRANSKLSNVDAKMNAVLDKATGEPAAQPVDRFRNGHGLGMSYEEPLATHDFQQNWRGGHFSMPPQSSLTIPGQSVFELHPNLFVQQVGGAALGDMFQVSDQPPKPFLQFPRDLFELSLHSS